MDGDLQRSELLFSFIFGREPPFHLDTPQEHRWVGGIELNRIVVGKAPLLQQQSHHPLPPSRQSQYHAICPAMLPRSVSAVAVWLAAVGYFLAHALLAQFLPHYVFEILHQPLSRWVAVPFLLLAGGHLLSHWLNSCMGEASSLKLRVLNTVGMVLSALFFLLMAVAQPRGDFSPR